MVGQSFFLLIGHFVGFLRYVNPLHDGLQVISYILRLNETNGATHIAISGKGKKKGEKAKVEKRRESKSKKNKNNKFEDNKKRFDGLKTEMQSMQKLEESH